MRLRELNLRIHTDGGSRGNPGPSGIGVMMTDADTGDVVARIKEYIGVTTNNQAEYRAVIRGLTEALTLQPASIMVVADSELLVRQLTGVYRVKNPDIAKRFLEIRNLETKLGVPVRYRHVPREQNKDADALANEAMDEGAK